MMKNRFFILLLAVGIVDGSLPEDG